MADFSYLPHKDKEYWNKKKEIFKIIPNNFSDLNRIFFNNKCKFFYKIEMIHKNEADEFLKVYNNLSELAYNLENILPEEIPLLKEGTSGKQELTRKEVALIFLLSFFNLIDIRQENLRSTNNFRVYEVLFNSYSSTFEFGRCFLNYLTIIGKWLSENNPILDEKISYIRDSKIFKDEIFEKETKLCEIEINEKGSLFDRDDSYGIDFANKYIGGGALEGGCVQEEILFAVEPEAIVSMFFMEVMSDDDAIRIDNTIQYSNYSGYGYNFKFKENAIDLNNLKTIKKTKFIAIDASVEYSGKYGLLDKDNIIRDIHKAYVGFNLVNFEAEKINEKEIEEKKDKKIEETEKKEKIEKEAKEDKIEKGDKEDKAEKGEEKKDKKKKGEEKKDKIEKKDKGIKEKIIKDKKIATGNWGCGAFGGDHELKFLQQWVAASFAGIKILYYYTFEATKMKFVIKNLDKIKQKYSTANDLYNELKNKILCQGEVLEILLGETNTENDYKEFNLFK